MLGWWRRWFAQRGAAEARADDADGTGDTDATDDADVTDDATGDDPGEPALTDELDLHTFQPRECADVVEEYLRAAHEAGMQLVRIVHGKGKGTLRRIVHGVLERHPAVRAFRLAEGHRGGWGATIVELHPRPPA